ncbi:helix-turn-helix domain-containing protein [Nocardia tengchongensis]|uniref:Helix-turn-helix domain-containing protein n=1 Tax=Nocardia tengchongensis TaxID=2055889 RepID=A0ABX8CW64_9NOCA|nr:helix-turn-helix domain-containing protein [Nocardia tengchongensis]QVI24139.1 helix-turn-helix domain-containing protein [Nocardia tengchongensis]
MQIAERSLANSDTQTISAQPFSSARERRRNGKLSWACERPEIGVHLRRRREALGLTQEEVAIAATTTLSSLRKWEAGLRNPSTEGLVAWCRALDLPDWMLRKVISLALNGLDTLRPNTSPHVNDDDLDHLEMFGGPAYYLTFPQLDVIAANTAARQLAPSLAPASPDSDRPTNAVEWIMTKPARELLVNWPSVATRMIHTLRVMGPGMVPQYRLDEIFNACYSHSPREFKRFFAADLRDAATDDNVALVRNPATDTIERYSCRALRPTQPMHQFEQIQLVRSSRPHGAAA